MKVTELSQGSNQVQDANQANPRDKISTSQEIKNQETLVDKVELLAQSKEIKKMKNILEKTQGVRTDRVAELKKFVQEDRYQVDIEALAEKLIEQTIIDLLK